MDQQTTEPLITMEDYMAQQNAVQFIIDNGEDWPDARFHICDVVYMDTRYRRQTIRKMGLTQRDAYEAARDAWLEEREAGRAL